MGSEITAPKEVQSSPEIQQESPNWDSALFESSSTVDSDFKADTDSTVSDASTALLKGDAEGLTNSIESAFESVGGNPDKFKQFGNQLKEEMQDKGYDVKVGENSLDLRKDGSEKGVRIDLNGELDFSTGKLTGEASAKAIDWETGKPTEGNPEELLGQRRFQHLLNHDFEIPSEGGGKFNPIDRVERPFNPAESVQGVASALSHNDFDGVKDSIKGAYEASKGNPQDFEKFGEQLQRDLAKQGYDVRFGENGVSLHKQGAENAVEFKVNGDINVLTGKLDGTVDAQTYDWETKEDVDANPEKALEGKDSSGSSKDQLSPAEGGGKFRPAPPVEQPMPHESAIESISEALQSGDYDGLKSTIEKAFEGARGNIQQFEKFSEQLQEELADQGYDVKFGRNRLSIHEQGSPNGVEFTLSGDMNVQTGEFSGKARAQAYDWNTKQDVNVAPEEALQLNGEAGETLRARLRNSRLKAGASMGLQDFGKFDAGFARSIMKTH